MPHEETTIIFTNSHDATVDLLLNHLPSKHDRIFRFNFDLYTKYDVCFSAKECTIVDPIGRQVNLRNIKKAYYRKPMMQAHVTAVKDYVEGELWASYRSLLYWLWEEEKIVLVEPFTEKARINKFYQLRIAQEFFQVPPFMFTTRLNHRYPPWEQSVVKSLTGGQIGDRMLFTTLVEPRQLDPSYPWFLQQYIDATLDITVVFVRGKIFSFQLRRDFLEETVDFRAPGEETWNKWQYCKLPEHFNDSITSYMEKLRLDYGRLDFLMSDNEQMYFCEVNPNGQFAWLDLENTVGLLGTIATEISPSTEVFSIPFNPFR